MLGLKAAVASAEEAVQQRRQQAVLQLAGSTGAACNCAREDLRAWEGAAASSSAHPNMQQEALFRRLEAWLCSIRQLHQTMVECGVPEALQLLQPSPSHSAWPEGGLTWLADARQAAALGLEARVLAAASALES